MANSPRVEITDKALKVLKIEAAIHGLGQKETLEALILRGASAQSLAVAEVKPVVEVKEIMELKEELPKVEQLPIMDIATEKPKEPQLAEGAAIESSVPDASQKRKRLEKDQLAIEQIKEMWSQSPRPTITEIARHIRYARSTTSESIKRMRKSGEISG